MCIDRAFFIKSGTTYCYLTEPSLLSGLACIVSAHCSTTAAPQPPAKNKLIPISNTIRPKKISSTSSLDTVLSLFERGYNTSTNVTAITTNATAGIAYLKEKI